MTDEHRTKIKNSQILNRLIDCAEGKVELTATQASVGLGLLRKVMPDLATTTIQGDEDGGAISLVHKIERVIVRPSDPNA